MTKREDYGVLGVRKKKTATRVFVTKCLLISRAQTGGEAGTLLHATILAHNNNYYYF